MTDDIVSARADFVQQVRCARREMSDWGGDGVRAANADGLVHVAHDRCRDSVEDGRHDELNNMVEN